MKLATAKKMQEMDRQAIEVHHIPSIELMERAAEGICAAVLQSLEGRQLKKCHLAVLCGAGNNGGDGIAAARLLFLEGLKVRVFLVGDYEKLTPDALTMVGLLSECGVELEPFDIEDQRQRNWTLRSDVVVDALFGVGLSRKLDRIRLFLRLLHG